MSKYIVYCRKPPAEMGRQAVAIESQIRELEQLAAKLILPVTEVLIESKSV